MLMNSNPTRGVDALRRAVVPRHSFNIKNSTLTQTPQSNPWCGASPRRVRDEGFGSALLGLSIQPIRRDLYRKHIMDPSGVLSAGNQA